MSEESMEINFGRSLEAANILKELAEILEQAAEGEILEVFMELRKNWTGEAAESFWSKGNLLYQKMRDSAVSLADAAQSAEQAARQIHKAEQRAIIIAEERKYR